ncbi:MAG TPA: putative glycoside hydrolase [Gaiellales bacterium]|jgi:hypothetical protein
MGLSHLARLGPRYGVVCIVLLVAAAAGAVWLAGPSSGDTPGGPATAASSVPAAPVSHPFFRAVYGYGGTRLTAAQEGVRYRVMILQAADAAMIPRLKANDPGLKVLMYVDMMSADPRDADGHSDWVGYTQARVNPGWILRGASGKPLTYKHSASFVMDVGNAAYQDTGVARVIGLAQAGGFDGAFLDDANASLRWIIPGGQARSVTYPTTASWQGAVYSFLTSVAPQLHRAGLLVVANIGGSTITPGLWQRWNGPIDGAMEESFTNGGTGRDSAANGQWPAKLAHAVWSEKHGKIALDHAVTATRAGARYGLATMLLAADGENLYSASTGYRREVWWPEDRAANDLGRPLGGYRVLRDGVYRRDFQHGVVLVDPHLHAKGPIRLGGTYVGSGLGRVRTVTLAGRSGVVLLRS